jgi:hypothetical protein
VVTDISAGPEIATPARAEGYTPAEAAVSTRGLVGGHPRARVAAFILDLVEVSMLDLEAACTRALAEVFMLAPEAACTQGLAGVFMLAPEEAYTRVQVVGCFLGRMANFTPVLGSIDGIFPLSRNRSQSCADVDSTN